jgi:DNA-binding MarR family transcriptional regulator
MTDTLPASPSVAAPLKLDDFLCFAVYAAGHAFNRVYQPLLKALNLTYPQFIAMIVLWEADGQTVGALGQKLSLQSNTLTPMLKRLEALGYIRRRRDPGDERQVCVHLTETGRSLRLRASEVVRQVRTATGLTDQMMDQLLGAMAGLRASLESQAQPES